MKKFLLIAGLAACSMAQAQTEVAPFQAGATVDGINYYLPQTALRVTVVAEKKVVKPGRYNKYAFRYLRLQDVPTESSTTWSIKQVTVEPYGVPDTQKAYNVKLKQKTSAPLLSLTHDGLILAINADKQETALPAAPAHVPAPAPLNPDQYMNQEMLQAGSSAKIAELCAQEIYDIRESRNELVRGESDNMPKDGAQLQLMLQQLDTQNQALTELFSGSTHTSTEVMTFTYLPTKATDREVLFRFSQCEGVVDADDLLGQPVYIRVSPAVIPVVPNAETDKKKAKMTEKGLFYNMPARTHVSVFDVNGELTSLETPMGQFGTVEILSDVLFDKHMGTKVYFHQSTGGIEKVEQ